MNWINLEYYRWNSCFSLSIFFLLLFIILHPLYRSLSCIILQSFDNNKIYGLWHFNDNTISTAVMYHLAHCLQKQQYMYELFFLGLELLFLLNYLEASVNLWKFYMLLLFLKKLHHFIEVTKMIKANPNAIFLCLFVHRLDVV